MGSKSKIKMLLAIMPRGKGEDVTDFLRDRNILFNLIILGKGTDTSGLSDLLGLGDSKKDIVFSVIEGGRVEEILEELAIEFNLKEKGHGVAFTVNINSVSCQRILNYFTGIMEDNNNAI